MRGISAIMPSDSNRSAQPGKPALFGFEKVADQNIEALGVIPLHPVGALIEDVQLGLGNFLKEQERLIERSSVIVATPQN